MFLIFTYSRYGRNAGYLLGIASIAHAYYKRKFEMLVYQISESEDGFAKRDCVGCRTYLQI
jgi:hypothetical protein